MTADDRALVLLTARFLHAAEKIDWLVTGLTLVAAVAIVFHPPGWTPAIAIVILGLIGKIYSVRISFDAGLFEDIAADRLSTAELDGALVALGFASSGKIARTWVERCRGAKRLVMVVGAIVTVQTLMIVMMMWLLR